MYSFANIQNDNSFRNISKTILKKSYIYSIMSTMILGRPDSKIYQKMD